MEKILDWIRGSGEFTPVFRTPQKIILNPGETVEILSKDFPISLRFLYIDSTGDDNVRLVIRGDTFYFDFTMEELMNYNINGYPRDYPSLILGDPNTSHYIVLFKPFPPLHINKSPTVVVRNEGTNPVELVYVISYTAGGV